MSIETKAPTGALSYSRVFAATNSPLVDEITWVERSAVIKNFEGVSIVEMHGLQFPDFWSQMAVNITAEKYFRQGTGDKAVETSLAQLITRVCRTIADDGFAKGYFDTPESAHAYQADLEYLCVNQMGAFNSPVWFNVGIGQAYGVRERDPDAFLHGWDAKKGRVVRVDPYLRPQGSACFIMSARDTIEGIWDLMKDSAVLFKYGSGVGSDWSPLRSSRESLSGGGQPSGPVSFMKVQDATGGTIKSGGKTRRAAIMQTLRSWHPDIREFVLVKQKEERKAWALIDAGYDGSFNGEAYGSVAFQNVNLSARLTTDFIDRANGRKGLDCKYPVLSSKGEQIVDKAGNVIYENACEILDLIAQGTYVCGDPGAQYEDIIQKWHTCPNSGAINSSNPCSEFLFLDDTSCNLASLNLRKFQRPDGTINVRAFRAAARVFLTAQEIMVDLASYPSAKVAENSHRFRPLGLGFANLGALLMSMGIPYDSARGRLVASCLMSIENAEAYAQSARIASNPAIGPFDGFAENKDPMMGVITMHRDAAYALTPINDKADVHVFDTHIDELISAARESSDVMFDLGEQHGFRNAQATVLAPTGTIGFMMDCDTTGVEPDIALVKYKLLAGKGDGVAKLVNGTVGAALEHLGYSEDERAAILDYIDKNDTIEGSMLLKNEHLQIFDCAFKAQKGARFIHYKGHIRMMAAVQPFISGAISKTVNVPETATEKEIRDIYTESHDLGIKAVAIYRENSKRSQPLSTTKDGNTKNKEEAAPVSAETVVQYVDRPRERLSDESPAIRKRFTLNGMPVYLLIPLYPDGRPAEVFIELGKEGTSMSGFSDAMARMISLGLQHGVPLEAIVSSLESMEFMPNGFTNEDWVQRASSVPDYLAKYLRRKFIDGMPADASVAKIDLPKVALPSQKDNVVFTASPSGVHVPNTCRKCGHPTQPSGACESCPNCGDTTGCG